MNSWAFQGFSLVVLPRCAVRGRFGFGYYVSDTPGDGDRAIGGGGFDRETCTSSPRWPDQPALTYLARCPAHNCFLLLYSNILHCFHFLRAAPETKINFCLTQLKTWIRGGCNHRVRWSASRREGVKFSKRINFIYRVVNFHWKIIFF